MADEAEQVRPPHHPSALRKWLPWVGRILVPTLLAVWLVRFGDIGELGRALAAIPLPSMLPALGIALFVVCLGGLRWQVSMGAFGAKPLPPLGRTIRVFFVGLFYTTYVPGTVAGDVLRGAVSRRHFESSLSSYAVVASERVIGLTGMVLLFLVGVALGPSILDLSESWPWLALLLLAGVVVLVASVFSRRLSRTWKWIPEVENPWRLALVLAISLAAHMGSVVVMWILAQGMGLPLSFQDMVFVVPVALVAQAVPLSIASLGPREVALVALLRLVGGIEPERALALSLAFASIVLVVGLVGGLLQVLLGRVSTDD